MPRGRGNIRTILDAERDSEIARYKVGRTYAQVAEHFSIAASTAHLSVRRAIDAAAAPAGRQVIAEELIKIDALEEAAWAVLRANHLVVSDGRVVKNPDHADQVLTDSKPVLMAIDRILRCQERRARLLGLDAPTRQTVTVVTEDVVDAEIRRLEQELAERGENVQP